MPSTKTLLVKRIDLSRPRLRRRAIHAFKSRFILKGGPIQSAWLSTPGTLIFKLGKWRGYYDSNSEWVQI